MNEKGSVFIRICLLIVGLLFCSMAYNQAVGIRSEFYSLDDGLSNRLVNDMTYTQPGFLWLATPAGVNKFDGYEFTIFNSRLNNEGSLSQEKVKNILINEEDNLVISYASQPLNIDILNPETHKIKKIKLTPSEGLRGVPRTIFSDRNRRIFILTLAKDGTRIFEFKPDGAYKEIFFYREERAVLARVVNAIHLNDGSFFINDAEKGLRWFNHLGKLIKTFSPQDLNLNYKDSYPSRSFILHEDLRGDIWFSFSKVKGIFRWQPFHEEVQRELSLPQNRLYSSLWEDNQGNLLFAETDGLGFYPEATKLFCLDINGGWHDFSFLIAKSSKIISASSSGSFFETLFLGLDTGLKVVKNRRSKVKTLLAQPIEDSERGAVMRGITEDETGNIYFAREVDYWYKWDPHSQTFDTLLLIDSLTQRQLDFNCGLEVKYDKVKQSLWGIVCNSLDDGLLVKYNPKTQKALTYSYNYSFSDFVIAPDSLIWLTYTSQHGQSGLVTFDPKTEKYTEFFDEEKNFLLNTYPRFLFRDSKGLFWIGSDSGLFVVNPKDGSHKAYYKSEGSISSNFIFEIYEDEAGKIWLGTTEGLNILDPTTDSVMVINTAHGLSNNIVCGIVPDGKGNYWIATYDGISYYNIQNNSFKNFYRKDGLAHNEFNRFSYHRGQDGMLYFGGVNGMNIFDPNDLLNDSTNANVLITQFMQYDRRADTIDIQESGIVSKNAYTISPYISYFQFDFVLNNFENTKNNRYSVWLEGYEKDYSFIKKNNSIRYYRLPPGSYTLHIRGANAGGNWSEPRSLKITVKRIFYKQLWFILLSVFALLGLATLLFRYFLNQRIKMERLRTKISSDLHDEVSGLLAGIAIQSDVLRLRSQDKLQKEKLSLIGDVSRKAISKMSDVIWSIDSRNDKMEDLLQRMKDHLVEVLSPKEVKYYINIKKINSKATIPVNIRQDLYLLFKESINNVVKHSDATEVIIRLYNEQKLFKMIIQDNGTENTPEQSFSNGIKKGQGMANMRMRAHRLGGELIISNQKGYMISLTMKRFT